MNYSLQRKVDAQQNKGTHREQVRLGHMFLVSIQMMPCSVGYYAMQ